MKKNLKDLYCQRPHVVKVGAGASRAVMGKSCPTMNEAIEQVGLDRILEGFMLETKSKNLEGFSSYTNWLNILPISNCCIMLYFTASYFVRFVSGTIISLFILISMKVIVLCLAVLEYKQIYYLKMPYQGVILLLSLYTTTWYTIFNLFTLAIKLRLICKYSYFNPISIIVVYIQEQPNREQ